MHYTKIPSFTETSEVDTWKSRSCHNELNPQKDKQIHGNKVYGNTRSFFAEEENEGKIQLAKMPDYTDIPRKREPLICIAPSITSYLNIPYHWIDQKGSIDPDYPYLPSQVSMDKLVRIGSS